MHARLNAMVDLGAHRRPVQPPLGVEERIQDRIRPPETRALGSSGIDPLVRPKPSLYDPYQEIPRPTNASAGGDMATGQRGYANAVRMESIQMAFGDVVALKNIDLEVGANEIVGLIGDNGAGKSTLMDLVTGVLRPTGGRLSLRDQLIDPDQYSVRRAHDLRIEAVHQEKSLADKQPLWRNLFVGQLDFS